MAQNPKSAASSLLYSESKNSCFDGDEFWIPLPYHLQSNQNDRKDHFFNVNRLQPFRGFAVYSEDRVKEMVEIEREHLPRDDYLKRLRIGDLDLSVRREAIDWICKAYSHYNFKPLCIYLSINYLDRFLSVYDLPGKSWAVQLLAVACLSLAAKMEETKVPLSVDLQVGEPKFVFESKTIQRMELLVLSTLKWRMHALTPFSFIDYFLTKINDDQLLPTSIFSKSEQLVLSTIKGIDFLEFRPSEVAAAVAISVSIEVQAVDIDKYLACLLHVDKGRVLKCVEQIKDLTLMIGGSITPNVAVVSGTYVPKSPNGVLEAACLSYKTDDGTVGSRTNSSQSSPDIKRRKEDNNRTSLEEPKSCDP